MAEKVLQFDEKVLLGELNNLEKVLLPRASYISLNKAVFDARLRLQDEARNRFKRVFIKCEEFYNRKFFLSYCIKSI